MKSMQTIEMVFESKLPDLELGKSSQVTALHQRRKGKVTQKIAYSRFEDSKKKKK